MKGWNCKDAGDVLGISPTKVTQALFADRAAFEKLARLMIADPQRTLVDLQVAMERVRRKLVGPGTDAVDATLFAVAE